MGHNDNKGKRQQRHTIIRDIVRAYPIKTQCDLVERLRLAGHDCTQATVSRDIVDMGLTKSSEGRYVLAEDLQLQRMVADFVREVNVGDNIVVVKTQPGTAMSVSTALDAASLQGALGTVAGDDTIMLVTESSVVAQGIEKTIEHLRR